MPAFPKPTATETDPVAGPNLTTHTALTTTAHGGIVASDDARLTNARTPTAHKTTHATGQSDAIAPSDIGAATAAAAAAAQSTADGAVTLAGTKAAKASNLSDLADAPTARTNLGLGTSAVTALDTDSTFAANSDTRVPSQKAVKTAIAAVDLSTLVPKSIMDAKGDVLTATADNTPVRKAASSVAGTRLSVNSSKSDGLEWQYDPLYQPSWNGLVAAAYDPLRASSTVTGALGYGYGSKIYIPKDFTITNVVVYCTTQGSGLTANQCQVGVYDSSGALIGRNGDVSAAFGSTGLKTVAITVESGKSLAVTAGDWVVVQTLFNGSGRPTLIGCADANGTAINSGLAAAAARFMNIGTGSLTTLPSALAGNSPGGTAAAIWMGLS